MATVADAVVRARVTSEVKTQAGAIFKSMGLTTSDAIRMMLVQVVAEKALPFEIKAPNATTQEAILASRAGEVTSFSSLDDMFTELNDD
jgi:DNA-damage-inducible protein J